jgi:hypothetical protein
LTKQVWITDKIKDDLDKLANAKNIPVEGLTCVLLRLALSDDAFVERVLKLIEKCDLKYGSIELEKKGW